MTTVRGDRWLLRGLEKQIQLARMKFKPENSRSVAIIKGRTENRHKFKINKETIPMLRIRSLKKVFDKSLRDGEEMKKDLEI